MPSSQPLLAVKDLKTYFYTEDGVVRDDASRQHIVEELGEELHRHLLL